MEPDAELQPNAPSALGRALRWLFRNRRTGGYTVAQWPNVALLVFIAAALAQRIFHPVGTVGNVARVTGVVALLLWAVDEMLRGVNPFRRALGAVVLAVSVAGLATRA